MPQTSQMYKNWVFTSYILTLGLDLTTCVYLQYQEEICPTSQRHHLQGVVCFGSRKRFTAVQKLLPGAHLEPCRNLLKSIEYCSKEDTKVGMTVYLGTAPAQQVSQLNVMEALQTVDHHTLIQEYPAMWRHYRILSQIYQAQVPSRNFVTSGILLSGPTGCGKSLLASLISPFLGNVYYADPAMTWFCGYMGQQCIVVDEFRGIKVSFLLRLLDRYPMQLAVKGGQVQMAAKTVIFTSNLSFLTIFKYLDKKTYLAVKRRLVEFKF